MITSQSWFELWRIFSRSVFPTILEHGTGLFRLEGILTVMLDRKIKHNILPSLRKQLTFRDATDSFSAKDVWEKMTRRYTDGFWLVEANFTSGTTNQKHYPNLGSDSSTTTTTTTTTTLYFTPNIQEIKIYNNSTDNDRGAGCPK